MTLLLSTPASFKIPNTQINITGSKSETNRLLLLQALFSNLVLENTSNSDDSEVMQKALKSTEKIIDIHHAGTAMRFLTTYFATQENKETILTGSTRMQERPIKMLVDALTQLGVTITYEKKDGFPPIKILGKKITLSKVKIPANISSQYISALLLIAPKLKNGLEIILEGEITSVPYIKMTLALLQDLGIETDFQNNVITVKPKNTIENKIAVVESDWSSASYFFSLVALCKNSKISLTSYKSKSLQGDAALVEIYKSLGVNCLFNNNTLTLCQNVNFTPKDIEFDLNNTPDIAQTIVVTCFGLGIGCRLTGLHTLKIKETDRLEALKIELTKLGALISVTNESLTLTASKKINSNISIATYNDHRMAMAFAPLALKVPILIENHDVVSKSYPDFWKDLTHLGFETTQK